MRRKRETKRAAAPAKDAAARKFLHMKSNPLPNKRQGLPAQPPQRVFHLKIEATSPRWDDAGRDLRALLKRLGRTYGFNIVAVSENDFPPPLRHKAIVEAAPDGFVRVFGSPHLDVRIYTRPRVEMRGGEVLVDDLIAAKLPPYYRDIYFPGCIRQTGQIEVLTPAELLAQQQFKNAWASMGQALKGGK